MYSSICVQCSASLNTDAFLEAVADTDIPGTATIHLLRTWSNVAVTAYECEICKLVLSNLDKFDDESPDIKIEFIFGSDDYDIKRIHLIYQGPVSGDADFATGHNLVLRKYTVHAVPSMSYIQ